MQKNFILAQTLYQQKIMIDPQDFVGKSILAKGIYDKTGLYFIEKILSNLSKPIILDIGANVGNHALRMGEYAEKIFLFEPQRQIFDCLKKTMELNEINHWQLFNFGLSDTEEKLFLYPGLEGNNCTKTFMPNPNQEKISAEEALVRVGDDVIDELRINHLDFIKIDVEGFEAKVICGLKKSIAKFRPIIFMEWDKEITKKQFKEFNLFSTVFNDYEIKSITRAPKEKSFFKKLQRLFNTTPSKQKISNRKMIGEFIEALDYRNIIFIPKEKIGIIENI
jgi:FkbM family methyltransferase